MIKIIRDSYRVAGMVLLLFWLFQESAGAAIYKWRDDQGKLHFTNDRSKIPVQYRGSYQKFKGVPEPKPKVEPEPEEQPSVEAPKPPSEEKPKPPPPLTEEEKSTMMAVYRPLIKVWNSHVLLLMEGEPVDKYLKRYVGVAHSSADQKKSIAETIGDIEHPLLVEIKSFLTESAEDDIWLDADATDLIASVNQYKERLMNEIPIENEFIRKLHQKLELETPPPLIPLEEALQKAAEKREGKAESEERRENSPIASDDPSQDKI